MYKGGCRGCGRKTLIKPVKRHFSGTLGSFGFHVRENQIFFLIIKAKFKQNNKVIRSYFLSLSGGVWEENKTVAL